MNPSITQETYQTLNFCTEAIKLSKKRKLSDSINTSDVDVLLQQVQYLKQEIETKEQAWIAEKNQLEARIRREMSESYQSRMVELEARYRKIYEGRIQREMCKGDEKIELLRMRKVDDAVHVSVQTDFAVESGSKGGILDEMSISINRSLDESAVNLMEVEKNDAEVQTDLKEVLEIGTQVDGRIMSESAVQTEESISNDEPSKDLYAQDEDVIDTCEKMDSDTVQANTPPKSRRKRSSMQPARSTTKRGRRRKLSEDEEEFNMEEDVENEKPAIPTKTRSRRRPQQRKQESESEDELLQVSNEEEEYVAPKKRKGLSESPHFVNKANAGFKPPVFGAGNKKRYKSTISWNIKSSGNSKKPRSLLSMKLK